MRNFYGEITVIDGTKSVIYKFDVEARNVFHASDEFFSKLNQYYPHGPLPLDQIKNIFINEV